MIEDIWYHQEKFGTVPKFVARATDIWDSKRIDLVGSSVHFIDPRTSPWEFCQLATGLSRPGVSHKANAVPPKVLDHFDYFGDAQGDLAGCKTDNYTMALKIGRIVLMSPENDGYTMHLGDLAIEQALGKLSRTQFKDHYAIQLIIDLTAFVACESTQHKVICEGWCMAILTVFLVAFTAGAPLADVQHMYQKEGVPSHIG